MVSPLHCHKCVYIYIFKSLLYDRARSRIIGLVILLRPEPSHKYIILIDQGAVHVKINYQKKKKC